MELGKVASAVIHKLNMGNDAFDVVLAGASDQGEREYVVPYIESQVLAAPRIAGRVYWPLSRQVPSCSQWMIAASFRALPCMNNCDKSLP